MRTLNKEEESILLKKEGRMNKKLNVTGIEYHELFPRTTLCKVIGSKETYGIAMKSKHDEDNPTIGKVLSFIRALNVL